MVTRTVENKVFDAGSLELIDVIVETYENGTVVEYRKPEPHMRLSIDKPQFLADGVDSATITVTFETCALVENEIVWTQVIPTGDVTFVVNLRPTVVTINSEGRAVLVITSTIEKRFSIRTSFPGYGEENSNVEALQ